MAEVLGFLIRKDGLGFKLSAYTEYNGTIFTTDSGEKVGKHQGFIAEPENIISIVRKTKMKLPEELLIPPLDADQIMQALKKIGHCLDHEWRIRRFMKEPFTKIKATNIMPLIEVHKQYCASIQKNPEATPLLIGWFEEALGIMVEKPKQGIMLCPEHDGGEICTIKDRMDFKRIVLKFGDWYAFPREQQENVPICALTLAQFVPDAMPTNAENVQEVLGNDKFLTPEGVIVGKGSYFNFSIDDILGPPPEDKK
jgi:hypothetical protein